MLLCDGDRREFKCATAVMDKELKIFIVEDPEGNRLFWTHIEDVVHCDESPPDEGDTNARVIAEFKSRGKIPAIKLRRTLTGEGLREAKHAVDELKQKYGLHEPR